MITITDKQLCCGCSACANACPKSCIEMQQDSEGFLYPHINESQCIQCNLCERVCPIRQSRQSDENPAQRGYVFRHPSKDTKALSSSGGFFPALAEEIIRSGGIVYGAAFDSEWNVAHTDAVNTNELKRLQGSKYVESRIGDTFRTIKQQLTEGKTVLFSGTPCQTAGLLSYLQKSYNNLYTMDIVCHAVPSPLIFQQYMSVQKTKYNDQIASVNFRDKRSYGYKYSTMSLSDKKNQMLYSRGIDTDEFTRAFFSDICDRPSCYACHFKGRYHVSDFTVWDCFDIYRFDPTWDDDLGTSSVLANTDKAAALLEKIGQESTLKEVDADALTKDTHYMFHSVRMHPKRKQFFTDAQQLPAEELFRNYFSRSLKNRAEHLVRVAMAKTGIYKYVKRAVRTIKKKLR